MKITDCMQNGKLYSFWDDAGENKFNVGYLLESDEDFTLFNSLTTTGAENGLYLTRTEDIFRIDSEDAYTKKIARLFHLQGETPRDWQNAVDSVLTGFLNYAKNNQKLLSVKTDDGDTVTGLLLDYDLTYDEETVTLRRIDDCGNEDGFSVVRLDCVERFASDSYNERAIELLYQKR